MLNRTAVGSTRLPSGLQLRPGLASVDARLKTVGGKIEIRPVMHVALSYEDSYSTPMRSPPLRTPGLYLYSGLVC